MVNSWKARALVCFGVLGAAAAGTACTSYETAARESFSQSNSCPIAGVTAKERPDLSAFDLIFGPPSKPPADVAADPARLALFQKKHDDTKKAWDRSTYPYEVAGCNEKLFYTCSRGGKSGRTSCSSVSRIKP